TTEATLPGYRHDHCAGFNPLTLASPAFAELALEDDGLEWVVPDVAMAHPLEDGRAIALHRDVGATAASLDAAAPGAGAAWSALVGRTLPHADRLVRSILAPLPPLAGPARLALAWRRFGVELLRRGIGSVEAFGRDVFDGAAEPTAWLASSAQHSGLPPSAAGSGIFGFMLQLLGHAHGWPLPRGGQGAVAAALVRRLEREGGGVRCEAPVDAVVVRAGRAAGVRLRGGEELAADAVVTTVSAGVLARLLPAGALPSRLERRLARWRYGTGAFKVDYALAAPVPWAAPEARAAGVVHVAGSLRELALAAEDAHRGDVPRRPALVVGQHSLFDATRAPAGGHTLYVYAHVPPKHDVPDDDVVSRIEAQLDRFAPGWRAHVLARRVRPPAQTGRENPSLVGGDLAGGTSELDQQLAFRPAPELCRHRTPLRGLYVAGASVHPGGAVHGMSGRGAARAVLADRAPLRLGALRYAGKG
ncbi:MAG TPA: NAD(P)/FAD-dependent oxidoreductase, partial [Solirubrobacteraceae bacterium]|nr:NAD(P)/FAD-dependent oxidoreductase [Solirubrobacteraceae bacterium]